MCSFRVLGELNQAGSSSRSWQNAAHEIQRITANLCKTDSMRFFSQQSFRALVATTILLAAALFVVSVFRVASATAEESAQRALMVEAEQLLDKYWAKHGEYPESLESLQLTFPDGGNQSTLALLQYNSDGAGYELVTQGVATAEEIRVSRPTR